MFNVPNIANSVQCTGSPCRGQLTRHTALSCVRKSEPSKRYSQEPRTGWSDVTWNHRGSCLSCSAPHWPFPSLKTVTPEELCWTHGSYSDSELCCSKALLLFPRTGGILLPLVGPFFQSPPNNSESGAVARGRGRQMQSVPCAGQTSATLPVW